jgi:hypothetical protein
MIHSEGSTAPCHIQHNVRTPANVSLDHRGELFGSLGIRRWWGWRGWWRRERRRGCRRWSWAPLSVKSDQIVHGGIRRPESRRRMVKATEDYPRSVEEREPGTGRFCIAGFVALADFLYRLEHFEGAASWLLVFDRRIAVGSSSGIPPCFNLKKGCA